MFSKVNWDDLNLVSSGQTIGGADLLGGATKNSFGYWGTVKGVGILALGGLVTYYVLKNI